MHLLNFIFSEILQNSRAEWSGQEKWRWTREQFAKCHLDIHLDGSEIKENS